MPSFQRYLGEIDFLTALRLGAPQDESGNARRRRQDPDAHVDHLGFDRSAEVQGLHRVAHGHVAIHAHHGEGEDAGEHVVVVDGDDHFAQHLPEGPRAHQVLGTLEWEGAGGESVGESQVEYVDVGGGLQLDVPGWFGE